jgi:UDP-N-acetylglucosamine 4,6-dehydratase
MPLKDKVILVTGGTGSFGQKFTDIILREYQPKAVRIFSRGEFLQDQMRQKFNNDERLRFFIGDVRDRDRVYRAMTDVDIVVHAAALKQVPTCEYNPIEAKRTNIDGAINVVDAAIDRGVEKTIAISSDKAVHPVNLYGATKLVMEKVVVQSNVYASPTNARFSCVRYGNVVGSRGSVIPLFMEQARTGVITITDERMTRFWITLEQGVRFVINCIERMRGGEIFVPKIPSMKTVDVAEVIAPGIQRKIIGIRPGEKLHEFLLTEDEVRHARELDDCIIVEPEFYFWQGDHLKGGRVCPANFKYSSDCNSWWLTMDEFKKIVDSL